MPLTPEQTDWLRTHRVTKCPPSPEFKVVWKKCEEQTEEERLSALNAFRVSSL
jgi:hypothetical protein